ncbi:MAG: hypothetical protein LC749_07375 [Actinobacteria bacterium]|nr:hypothetical protein [Actinomycetota bacterium]
MAAPGVPPANGSQLLLIGQIPHRQVSSMLLDLWVVVLQRLASPVVIEALHF